MGAIDNIIKMYNDFKSNEQEFWVNRFTYKRDMKYALIDIDIFSFERETKAFEHVNKENTIGGFLKIIDSLSKEYSAWATLKHNDIEPVLLEDWFKGAIGEYFYYCVLSDVKCLYISHDATNEVKRYDFNYISPIKESDDHGIDFVGTANDTPCVFQMKTYHDFNKFAEMTWYLKAYGEGCANDYINQHDKDTTFLCWFGSEKNGLTSIRGNRGFNDKALCIGYNTLKETIDKRNSIFWTQFYNSLCNIK